MTEQVGKEMVNEAGKVAWVSGLNSRPRSGVQKKQKTSRCCPLGMCDPRGEGSGNAQAQKAKSEGALWAAGWIVWGPGAAKARLGFEQSRGLLIHACGSALNLIELGTK